MVLEFDEGSKRARNKWEMESSCSYPWRCRRKLVGVAQILQWNIPTYVWLVCNKTSQKDVQVNISSICPQSKFVGLSGKKKS